MNNAKLAWRFGAAIAVVLGAAAQAQTGSNQPWLDSSLTPDRRAELAVGQMTRDEKLKLVFGYFATDADYKNNYKAPPEARYGSAGYVPGISRLGIPPQWQTDAGVGVATQGSAPDKRERTSLPSGIATAATWNPELAFKGGQMIGDLPELLLAHEGRPFAVLGMSAIGRNGSGIRRDRFRL